MSVIADGPSLAAEPGLLRGTGSELGPRFHRMPADQRTLLHVLDRQADERPDHDWLVFDSRDRLTFGDARSAVDSVAAALTRCGHGGSTVALLLRNQREFAPAFLGAQAAGGLSSPLNPELRGQLLTTMLERCGASVLVTRADALDILADAPDLAGVELVLACGQRQESADVLHGRPVLSFDEWIADGPSHNPLARPSPWDLAALMFTSGTSGGSKAAMWSHHYLYLSSATVSEALGHTADDILSTPLQMCHIAGLQNFAHSALQVGCTAHLKSRFSASRWWNEVAEDGATFAMLMGPMAAMILDATPATPRHRMSHVYMIPRPAQLEEFERRYSTNILWQGWGMTEIFPHLPTKTPLQGVSDDAIGPAPAWVDFGVVDQHDRLLAPGEVGEMVYRPLLPDAMARGYYGDAAATAHAFRNFMFHTGDLGYYDEDGIVHFLMRGQDAIRRRGENISATELEAIARTHPSVTDAAAYAVPSELGEHEVKLDLLGGDGLDLEALHQWLTLELPRFMVPTYLEHRSQFPRTVSLRVEKYKLAAEGTGRSTVRKFSHIPRRK